MRPGLRRSLTSRCLTASWAALFCGALWAQTDPQSRIEAAAAALGQLDSLAAECRTALETGSDDEARSRCQRFLGAVDGELLAGYLEQCAALKAWRDEFVSSAAAAADDAQAAANLALMVGIERNCGEDALANETSDVLSTFALLRDRGQRSNSSTAALNRRLQEMNQQALRDAQQDVLRGGVQRELSRRLLETEQQWQSLELELLRQQIRNPPPTTN